MVRNLDPGRVGERLINNAIAFGQFKKRGELFFARIRVQIETQSDLLKADRNFFGDSERSAKIEIAFRSNGCVAQRNFKRSGNRAQSDSGAGHQRFE